MKNFFLLIIFLILSIENNKYIFSQIDLPSETELLEIYSNEDALKEHQELNLMTVEAADYVNKQNLLIFKISSSFRELLISESEDEIRSLFFSLKNYLNEINLNIDTLDSRISKIKSNSEVNLISWKTYYRYLYNIIIDIVDHNKDLADINKRYINNVFEFFEFYYEDELFNNLIIKLDKLTSENRFLHAKFL